jgi:outer membrane protein OmpA-like peptidoglycan-associated protein
MGLSTKGKILFGIIFIAIIGFVGYKWEHRPKAAQAATEIGRVSLAPEQEASITSAKKIPLPSNKASANTGSRMTFNMMEWNAQFALMYANGGPVTTKGSLIEQANLQITLLRQDDCNKTCADLTKFAQEYKKDPSTPGVFGIFMGDGMPAFNAGFYAELAKIETKTYNPYPITFYTVGKSYGEDKFMGPPEWRNNPQGAVGATLCCVVRDGDMNIAIKWCGDNNIKMNPDITTYDPSALNIINASDFQDAVTKYVSGYTDPRKLVVKGMVTGRDTSVGIDAIATWTPGDVNEATLKGGLVTIASTKQYSTQMPAVIFTVSKYAYDHHIDIENLIAALGAAGDQVRSFADAKALAGKISAEVYNDKTGDYWLKYYNGVKQHDLKGLEVDLGGSMAFNLADAANMFGLGNDRVDRYKAVYTTFGNIMQKMYPTIIPTYPDYQKVVDKSFMRTVLDNHPELLEGKPLQVQYAEKITTQISSKSYQGKSAIQFASGSYTINPSSYAILDEIFRSAIIAENCKLGVYGHTDNVGNSQANQILSEKRAMAVRDYLIRKGLKAIEAEGKGDSEPIADNATPAGREQNRRVQIVLGQ